ncbi:hypothetical protein H4219_005298 [Mycoemilia scoparia]|uniref:Transketolase-like pyrimidine-binding domain-containing protein n=1 Tax=Mycoemilia scoparia TaxID=417184 RepID=A0A9W7ZNJ6_9FUNG|nr:hypothetical protein H4219_005298 [Mycoemilia scoparia]
MASRLLRNSYLRVSAAAAAHFGPTTRSIYHHQHLVAATATTTGLKTFKRQYHEDVAYGFRVPKQVEIPDYTPEEMANRQSNAQLVRLANAYRDHAHRASNLDPLNLKTGKTVRELDPARYGLTDLSKRFNPTGIIKLDHQTTKHDGQVEDGAVTLETIIGKLKSTYSGKIAYEFMHIPDSGHRKWFADLVEDISSSSTKNNKPSSYSIVDSKKQKRLASLLTKSEVFDQFMHKKFGSVKRYGLEGAESMLIVLDQLFESGNLAGIKETVLCMPHRGRLNLLADLLQYPLESLFRKLQGNSEFPNGIDASGDVLSHLASSPALQYTQQDESSSSSSSAQPIRVSLLENPSHLEAVNPVALGNARARQMYLYDANTDPACTLGDKVMCVQLHGDAAFTGQGIVMETLGLSNLPHFSCGGTIHIIVNNQIGYTTPAENARSTVYTSDIGKMVDAPIIHVNGDYPEEVVKAALIAFEYRKKFRRDVIIDLITFRRWGHNELDEPSFTQPKMYEIIRGRPSVPALYEQSLIKAGVMDEGDVKGLRDQHYKFLEDKLEQSKHDFEPKEYNSRLEGRWEGMVIHKGQAITKMDTGVDIDVLKQIGKQSVNLPDGFKVHPRLQKFHINPRLKHLEQGTGIDWATAESLAFGTLLQEDYHVCICGQDVGRGTFSQRHVMFVNQDTEDVYVPFNELSPTNTGGKIEVANSHLSELAVLGFEYGASWATPKTLPIWESQFGDFNNSAQVIIDTYVASGETKWLRQSGLVMLLPHGYDGAGPEHSSCRIERFLQLSDDPYFVGSNDVVFNPNIQVAYPTTPAQYFHLLRRQMLRKYRKPLVVAGPKTLLRLATAVSKLEDMQPGTSFQPVLDDPSITANNGGASPSDVKRVVFLSGKLYYDLAKTKESLQKTSNKSSSIALIRIEELTPFPKQDLLDIISKYSECEDFVWCQEETQNAGAFTYIAPRLQQLLPAGKGLRYIGRGPLAAPVTGIGKIYKKEQQNIIDSVFRDL